MISIPVLGYAWRKYGNYWWQLEAPRHFYLHTRRSMNVLCNETGFEIVDILYNSTYWQFIGSELLQRSFTRQNIALGKVNISEFFNKSAIKILEKKASQLNIAKDGDQAMCFLRITSFCR